MDKEKLTRISEVILSFVEGGCRGGRLAQGANTLLCSLILYVIMYWAFVGNDSAWQKFKEMEHKLDNLSALVANNVQNQTEQEARNMQHFNKLDGQVATLDDRTQALNTKVQVLDATTLKIGGPRERR